MLKTIKIKKELTLLGLLQKFDAGEVPRGKYKTGYGNWVNFDVNRKINFSQNDFINHRLTDVYEVEFEEEITEDTVFDRLIFVYKEASSFYINSNRCASVGEIVRYLNCDEVTHIYIMNPDGTIGDLIWSNGEMVE